VLGHGGQVLLDAADVAPALNALGQGAREHDGDGQRDRQANGDHDGEQRVVQKLCVDHGYQPLANVYIVYIHSVTRHVNDVNIFSASADGTAVTAARLAGISGCASRWPGCASHRPRWRRWRDPAGRPGGRSTRYR
jgi:hypothetical protein